MPPGWKLAPPTVNVPMALAAPGETVPPGRTVTAPETVPVPPTVPELKTVTGPELVVTAFTNVVPCLTTSGVPPRLYAAPSTRVPGPVLKRNVGANNWSWPVVAVAPGFWLNVSVLLASTSNVPPPVPMTNVLAAGG